MCGYFRNIINFWPEAKIYVVEEDQQYASSWGQHLEFHSYEY